VSRLYRRQRRRPNFCLALIEDGRLRRSIRGKRDACATFARQSLAGAPALVLRTNHFYGGAFAADRRAGGRSSPEEAEGNRGGRWVGETEPHRWWAAKWNGRCGAKLHQPRGRRRRFMANPHSTRWKCLFVLLRGDGGETGCWQWARKHLALPSFPKISGAERHSFGARSLAPQVDSPAFEVGIADEPFAALCRSYSSLCSSCLCG
jgi:hypothetical protein